MPRGRHWEARRNDARVLEAALDVFAEEPTAAMSAVARRAGVGQATLYRRYPNKSALLVAVARHGLEQIAAAVQAALDDPDPWSGVSDFLAWYADSGTLRTTTLLGTFQPPEELFAIARRANADMQALVDQAVSTGRLRTDVTGADLTLLATQIAALTTGEPERTASLRRRYVDLALQGLSVTDGPALTGPAPDADELEAPWQR